MKNKIWISGLFLTFLFLTKCLVFADTQNDIGAQQAVSIIKEYEKAYTDKDLNKMLEYVDRSSDWFKKGFIDEFKAVFENFTNINLYRFKVANSKNVYHVYYVADGVEIVQPTLYIAYGPSVSDVNEIMEDYYLRKVDGKYKIAECNHLPSEDAKLIDNGTGAMLKNDAENAVTYFRKALKINPDNSVAYFRLGMIYSKTGKLKEAEESLRMAAELRPNVGFYRFYLSQAYILLQNKEKASEEMGKALALDPGLEIFFREKVSNKKN